MVDARECGPESQLDGTVQLWDTIQDMLLFTYQPYSTIVWAVAWSPDGKRIASASLDGTAQVWDDMTGKHALIYRGHAGPVFTVAWSLDGTHIASAGLSQLVQVWQA